MNNITREHVVPMNVLESHLFPYLHNEQHKRAIDIIDLYGKMALITRKEDDELNRLGLRTTMPTNGSDPLARYNIAGIRIAGNLSALAPTYRIQRGGRGRLCCRDIRNLSVEQLVDALIYHYKERITGPSVVSELLRAWQLGQDFLVSEDALAVIRS